MFVTTKTFQAVQKQLSNMATATTLHFRDIISSGLGVSHNGKRDAYDVYGYPENYSFRLGYNAIRREGIANRVVKGVAQSCWRNGFVIMEGTPEDETSESVLDDEVQKLNQKQLFSRIERADVLSRIGDFAALFVGIPDGLEFNEPIGKVNGDGYQSIYFRPFAYDGITIAKYDTEPTSERFGLPELYQLQVMGRGDTAKTQNTQPIVAHWSRVLHLAENLLDSDIEGIPALEPIYNRILDIDKATGGAAEAYFRNARGKIAFEVDPEFASDLLNDPTAKEAFDTAGKKFTNDWEDQITAVGSKVHSVVTPHQSPLDTVKTALWAISGYTGIPIRVLTGEGSGQLAGSEDRLAYGALVNDRQDHVCSVWVITLLEMLETAGMLTLPKAYYIDYPLDEPLTEFDKAELANKRADTLTKLTAAASSMAGDSINLKSALEYFDLDDIAVDEMEELSEVDPVTGDEVVVDVPADEVTE